MSERLATKHQRIAVLIAAVWAIGWTIYAYSNLESVCPLGNGEWIDCWNKPVDYVWTDASWKTYFGGLIVPTILIVLAPKVGDWIRSGK